MSAESDASSESEVEISPEEMPLSIQVVLDRAVYFVGQSITGVVRIENEHKRRMRGVKLTIMCKAEVSWRRKNKRGNDVKFMNNLNLLFKELYVHGDGKNMFLRPGKVQYPFAVPLVSDGEHQLPSSMEFPKGSIRYIIRAEIDWPWASVQDDERAVSVLHSYNLREHKNSLQPVTFAKVSKVGIRRRDVTIAGQLEKMGYVAGEEILMNVEIANRSKMKISRSWAELIMHVVYTASDGSQLTSSQLLQSVEYSSIPANSELVLHKEPLLIPPVVPSGVQPCSFLHVSYEVAVCAMLKKRKQASHTIIIGTLPTRNSYRRFDPGELPLGSVCEWPFLEIKGVPFCQIVDHFPNPEMTATGGEGEEGDEGYRVKVVNFDFNRKAALDLYDVDSDDSDDDSEDSDGNRSDLSL